MHVLSSHFKFIPNIEWQIVKSISINRMHNQIVFKWYSMSLVNNSKFIKGGIDQIQFTLLELRFTTKITTLLFKIRAYLFMLRVSHKCNSLRLFPRMSFFGAVITNENSVLAYWSKKLKSFVFIAMYIIEMLTN